MKSIIIIGAGGFGLELLDLIEQINLIKNQFIVLGFLDDKICGAVVPGINVIGTTQEIINYNLIQPIRLRAYPLINFA